MKVFGWLGFAPPLRSQPLLLPTQPDNHRHSPFRRSSRVFKKTSNEAEKTCQPIKLILVVWSLNYIYHQKKQPQVEMDNHLRIWQKRWFRIWNKLNWLNPSTSSSKLYLKRRKLCHTGHVQQRSHLSQCWSLSQFELTGYPERRD